MAASGEERKFNPEGLWWLLACLKLQQGMRTITLNRTVVEICMFCYMKVAIPPRDSGPQNHFWAQVHTLGRTTILHVSWAPQVIAESRIASR